MSAELAALPQRTKLRVNWAGAARFTLPGVILVTLIVELLLAERKYALFGGGFGQSQTLDTPLEIGAFLAGLLLCQIVLFLLLYRLMRRLHRKRPDGPLFHFNFIFFVGGGALALLIGKYQALAFFSDAMSFQIVRNLGGGSLADALLYSLSEAGLMLIVGGGALGLLRGRALRLPQALARRAPPLPDHWRLSGRQLALLLAATPLVLFAVNRVDDSRAALSRFNSAIVITTLLEQATDFDRDGYSFFSFPLDGQPFDGSRHPYALDIPGDGIDQDGLRRRFRLFGERARSRRRRHRRPPAQCHPDRARKHPRRRHRAPGRRAAADADARRAGARRQRRPPRLFACRLHHRFAAILFTGKLAPTDDRQSLVRDFLANGYEVGAFSGQAEDFGNTATPRRPAPRRHLRRRHDAEGRALRRLRRAGLGQHRRPDPAARVRPAARPPRGVAAAAFPLFQPAVRAFPLFQSRHGPDPARRADRRAARSAPPIATASRIPIGTPSPITTG